MVEGPAKVAAIEAHWDLNTAIKDKHPEPKQAKFEHQLTSSEASQLAAREIEDKRRKDDADKCLGRFKALAGTTITTALSPILG
jgi:hypothetical protein